MNVTLALRATAALGLITISACGNLPKAGPSSTAIKNQANVYYTADTRRALVDYVVVDLSQPVVTSLEPTTTNSLGRGFGSRRGSAPTLPLGPGDIVEISLFESAAGGLFVPSDAGSRPGNFITLPQQTIDADGIITVPYAGQIKAAGRTQTAVKALIEQRLADRAIEPQAVVRLVQTKSREVAVLGDVRNPAKISISAGGERVLDVISQAGGISAPATETSVTLQRDGRTATVLFDTLLNTPSDNIYVYPGDTIYVNRDRRTFVAFGASGENGRIDFEESNLTLAEAVGKSGGLLDERADPGQVFVYRLMPARQVLAMGLQTSIKDDVLVPVIFRANFRDPSSYFLAQRFLMQDKDILYIDNAKSVEVSKVLDIIGTTTQGTIAPVVGVRNLTRN
ncbi:sugar ABC transporter substrate-binding protein [Aurantimonas sp. Leaf443]|nr:sugar ABC transporter substrate-binding protein [Aurantimonas sp. Leaf443]